MSTYWDRVRGILGQQNQMYNNRIDQSIASARDFQRRYAALRQQRINNAPASALSNPDIPYDAVVAGDGLANRYMASGNNVFGSASSGSDSGSGPGPGPGSGSGSGVPVYSQPQTFDYLDAPWASAYGMSKETAYSEAMENTAYRRSVTDMQKAGLNPAVIFGAGNGYTAGSPNYISSASSGSGSGGGSGSRRSRGSSRSRGRAFSSSAYSILSTLGGIVGAAATHSAGGYWIGTSLTQGAMNAIDAFSRWRR